MPGEGGTRRTWLPAQLPPLRNRRAATATATAAAPQPRAIHVPLPPSPRPTKRPHPTHYRPNGLLSRYPAPSTPPHAAEFRSFFFSPLFPYFTYREISKRYSIYICLSIFLTVGSNRNVVYRYILKHLFHYCRYIRCRYRLRLILYVLISRFVVTLKRKRIVVGIGDNSEDRKY